MSDRIVFEKNGKTITLAEHSGFCYGVKTALQKTLKTVEEYEGTGRRVYTFGPIIHNDDVVNDLNMRGVQICSAPGSTEKDAAVIIRSHGVPASVEAALRDSCGQLIDATCPHVKKIHRLADDAYHEGRTIVVIGDAGHPEVQGIDGWCGNEAMIFSDPAEIERPKNLARLNRAEEILAVAQTTLNRNAAQKISPGSAQMYHLQRDIQPADRLPQSGGDIGRYGGHRRPQQFQQQKTL